MKWFFARRIRGEYSHPPMLRVSTKRYHKLFDSSSSSSPQSSIPDGVPGMGDVRPSSNPSSSGERRGELSLNGSKEGRPLPIFAGMIDFRFGTSIVSWLLRKSDASYENLGDFGESGGYCAINIDLVLDDCNKCCRKDKDYHGFRYWRITRPR